MLQRLHMKILNSTCKASYEKAFQNHIGKTHVRIGLILYNL